jgi:hypothetical protein
MGLIRAGGFMLFSDLSVTSLFIVVLPIGGCLPVFEH